MSDPKYLRQDVNFCLAHAVEEAGEVVQALGKTLRWGTESCDPTVCDTFRETNIDWVRREWRDLQESMDRLFKEYRKEHPLQRHGLSKGLHLD